MNKQSLLMSVRDLTKWYEGHLAVDRLTLSIEEGESFGLLGPNGAGKTTTIKMLTGQLVPTSGTIYFKGENIQKHLIKAKKRIGIVPDLSNLYPEMSIFENLMFAAQLYAVPKKRREARGKHLLKLFSLYERRKERFGALSRGLKKRIAIAAALIHEPDLLFLDEPTTGLDVQSARLIRKHLKKLHEQGTTLFLTTHYIKEADELCERIAFLDQGIIRAMDHPDKLKAQVQEDHIIDLVFHREGMWKELLEQIPGVIQAQGKDAQYKLYVERSSDVFPSLIEFSRTHQLRICSLNTITPSLEDAFVKITGLPPATVFKEK